MSSEEYKFAWKNQILWNSGAYLQKNISGLSRIAKQKWKIEGNQSNPCTESVKALANQEKSQNEKR